MNTQRIKMNKIAGYSKPVWSFKGAKRQQKIKYFYGFFSYFFQQIVI